MEAASPSAPSRPARSSRARLRTDAPADGACVSAEPYRRTHAAETIAGFLASAAIFVSLAGVAYRPLRLIPLAILLALVAAAIGGRATRLATFAVALCAACFAVGLAAAVITSHPLW
jgi:hypothetical protein